MNNTKLFLLIGTSLSLIPHLTSAQCVATQDCATLGRKIARLWATPKPLAPAAAGSNAPLATNGLASNPSRNFAMNMASLSPAPEDKSESAKPATANTPNVAALSVISGTIRLKNVKMPPPTVLLARCITATVLAQMTIFPVRNCLVL